MNARFSGSRGYCLDFRDSTGESNFHAASTSRVAKRFNLSTILSHKMDDNITITARFCA
jgi:hypothetical protein